VACSTSITLQAQDSWIDVTTIHTLPADQTFEGVNSWAAGGFNLNGNRLTIGAGGINIHTNSTPPKIYGDGSLTSNTAYLRFNLKNTQNLGNGYEVNAKIEDHASHKVGLSVSGGVPSFESHIDLAGNESNTFTGDVHISGHAGILLYKENAATAIRGNIFVNGNGYLALGRSNQIADSATITLNGNGGTASLIYHVGWSSTITEKIHKLVVNNNGVIDFYHHWPHGGLPHGTRDLYLDDLEVTAGSELLIKEWELGRDNIFVRKDSAHLWDSLTRIRFEGAPAGWHGVVQDYDSDYWLVIAGLPEPSTYGAILGAAGLGLWFCRRRLTSTSGQRAARPIKGSKTP